MRPTFSRPGGRAVLAVLLASCGSAPPPAPPEPLTPAPPPATTTGTAAGSPATAAPGPLLGVLPNGIAVAVTTASPGRDALLQCSVLAGTVFQAPGVAELAAATLLHDGDPGQGRPSLAQRIARLGGTAAVHSGPLTTWFDLRVPPSRWQEAVRCLRDALAAPTHSRRQIERHRQDLAQSRSTELRDAPLLSLARLQLLGDRSGADHVNDLLDRDPAEVETFLLRHYRPDRLVVALEVPGEPQAALGFLQAARPDSLGTWVAGPPPAGVPQILDRKFQGGVAWAPSDSPTGDVALVFLLPDLARGDCASQYVVHDCVTLDGTGGRLEQLQQERGLGHVQWQARVVQSSDAAALVLTATLAPDEAAKAWQLVGLARRSLRDVPPTASELELARRRAPLTARLAMLDPGARLRIGTSLHVRGITPAELDRRFTRLADPQQFDVRGAVEAYLELPTAMLVVGGKPPAELPLVTTIAVLPPDRAPAPATAATTPPTPAADAVAAAKGWLDRAMEAVGGRDLLQRLTGSDASLRVQQDGITLLVETVEWHFDGRLSRTRDAFGQRIVTTLGKDRWSERLGADERVLTSQDAAALRAEPLRHPLALLAAHARGELAFRVVSQRTVGDRDHLVLEALGDTGPRLRLHLDAESGLPRTVEAWQTGADGAVVHLQEAWSDYRRVDGLRAPFRRLTTQDDGQNRLEATYDRWVPKLQRP